MNNLNNNSQLGYYLAGLIEGDGNIWTPIPSNLSEDQRIYNPQIGFSLHTNNLPFFKHLKTIIGTGALYKIKDKNAYVYRISDKNTLIHVIGLINGKFRTPKISYLHRAIDHMNLIHGTKFDKLPLDNSNLEDSPWLAGFTDADGNFLVTLEGLYGLNNSKSRGRVACSYSLCQRRIDKATGLSCVPFMTEIANLFQCKISYRPDNAIYFIVVAKNKHDLVKSYFNKYPLMTSKWLNYLCYLEGLNYSFKRLTNEEILSVQQIKNSMNNKRSYFNWDHLENLYK